MILPPCKRCHRRRPGCHNAEYCSKWEKYTADKARYDAERKRIQADYVLTQHYIADRVTTITRINRNHHAK